MAKRIITFNKSNIEGLPLPKMGDRDTYHDSKINGLQLRVTGNGVKTFSVYRWVSTEGKPERVTLGRFPDLSIEKAREKATTINAAIANKENPNDAIRADKAEMTFKQLFDVYLERWAKPHKKSWEADHHNYRRYIQDYTKISSRKLSRITKTDIANLHSDLGKTRPIIANRVLALISGVFGRAIEWGLWNKQNPAQGIRKFPEKSRDRFIQSEELPVFFESLAHEPSELLQDYFMLLLLTGVRRSNLMAMRWDEISFERKEWRIPETKNGTPQIISLDDTQGAMLRILENRKAKIKEYKARAADKDAGEYEVKLAANASKWVFPSAGSAGHLVEPRKGWERILARTELFQLIGLIAETNKWDIEKIQEAKIEAIGRLGQAISEYRDIANKLKLDITALGLRNLRIHDLRRTLGSWMAGTGASTVIIGRQLNHKSATATAVYSRLQQDPVIQARNKALTAIFGAAGVMPSAEVIAMRKK